MTNTYRNNRHDTHNRNIIDDTDILLLKKESEQKIEVINGVTYKKISYLVVNKAETSIDDALEQINEIVEEKQSKIEALSSVLKKAQQLNKDVLHLYKNTCTEFFVKQKLHDAHIKDYKQKIIKGKAFADTLALQLKQEQKELKQCYVKLNTANNTIAALNKFQVKNNILAGHIKKQGIIIEYLEEKLDKFENKLKHDEEIIAGLKILIANQNLIKK